MDDCEERRCCFFVSGRDSAPLLEASPEVLDKMSTSIGPFWAGDRPIASFRRNGGPGSHVPYPFTKGVRRVVLVRHHSQGNGGKVVEHGSRRLVVSPDVCAIQKSHTKRYSLLLLNQCEQALPHLQLLPANAKLCRPPPRAQFSGDTPPFRTILMAPENRCYRAP